MIFDCCYAGWLRDNWRAAGSSFEYLGACEKQELAYGPDCEYSYTKALTLALDELSDVKDGFHTVTLNEKIIEHQQNLRAQVGDDMPPVHPIRFQRDPSSHNSAPIWIHKDDQPALPGGQQCFQDDPSDGNDLWQSWLIRLNLNQELTIEAIKQIGDSFHDILQRHGHQGLQSVELIEPQDLQKANNAVWIWQSKVRERRSSTELKRIVDAFRLPSSQNLASDSGVGTGGSSSVQLEANPSTPTTLAETGPGALEIVQIFGAGTIDATVDGTTAAIEEAADEAASGTSRKRGVESAESPLPKRRQGARKEL